MSKQRPTYAKLQREREKREKQQQKAERRLMRTEETDESDGPGNGAGGERVVDQSKVLAALDALHKDYEDERINTEDFEARRDELLAQLRID